MSPVHVFLSLILLTLVSLGVGCRAFSADSKDGVSVSESRPLSYQDSKPEGQVNKPEGQVNKENGIVRDKSDADKSPSSAGFEDSVEIRARKEFEAGQKAWDYAVNLPENGESGKSFALAEKHFWNALALLPLNTDYINAWRLAAYKSFSPEDCLKKIAGLAESYVESVPLAILYGRAFVKVGDFDSAIRHLEKSLEFNIDSHELAYEILNVSFLGGKFDKAVQFYKWLADNGFYSLPIAAKAGRWWHALAGSISSGKGLNQPGISALSLEKCTQEWKKATQDVFELAMALPPDAKDNMSLMNAVIAGNYLAEMKEKELLSKFFEKMDNFPGVGDRILYVIMKMDSLVAVNDRDGALKAAGILENCSDRLDPESLDKLAVTFMRYGLYSRSARIYEMYISAIPAEHSAAMKDRLVMLYYNAREYDNAILALQLYEKPTAFSYFIAGHSYNAEGKYLAAYREYKRGKAAAAGGRKIEPYHYMGFAQNCYALGKIDEALIYAEKTWLGNKDDHRYCNFYGYILADAGRNLDFARKLIESAVKAKPDNVAYLDSMAWVLYRQGDFAGAEEYMRRIMKIGVGNTEESFEIYGHFGDILLAVGKKDEARNFWNKALECTKDPEAKKKLEKKLSR